MLGEPPRLFDVTALTWFAECRVAERRRYGRRENTRRRREEREFFRALPPAERENDNYYTAVGPRAVRRRRTCLPGLTPAAVRPSVCVALALTAETSDVPVLHAPLSVGPRVDETRPTFSSASSGRPERTLQPRSFVRSACHTFRRTFSRP